MTRLISEAISRELLGKIIDEVFDGAVEDPSVIEEIYAAIKRHESTSANCPRPCNHRPDIFAQADCIAAGECGCGAAIPSPSSHVLGGVGLIAAERERQIAKGYDAAHDDQHKAGEIITADWGAHARIEAAINPGRSGDSSAYKELLAEAAAQCVAEIDRVERAEGKANA